MGSRFAEIRAGRTDGRRDRIAPPPLSHETVSALRVRLADSERERARLAGVIAKLEAGIAQRDTNIAALNAEAIRRAAVEAFGEPVQAASTELSAAVEQIGAAATAARKPRRVTKAKR